MIGSSLGHVYESMVDHEFNRPVISEPSATLETVRGSVTMQPEDPMEKFLKIDPLGTHGYLKSREYQMEQDLKNEGPAESENPSIQDDESFSSMVLKEA